MADSQHSTYEHIVFSTKNRIKALTPDIKEELFAYIAGIIKRQKCKVLIVGGEIDHIHILVHRYCMLLTPTLVKEIKRSSTLWLKGKDIAYRKFSWQAGYGAFSISYWDLEKIENYIREQETHHKKMDWENEYRKLLKKHGVEIDEKHFLD